MKSASDFNSPAVSRREFFMALWSLRVVRWTAVFFIVAIGGMALWVMMKAMRGQAWGTAFLPVLFSLVAVVVVPVSLTIAFGGFVQWFCDLHLPLMNVLAFTLLSAAMVVVYIVAKLRGYEGLLTGLFGLIGTGGLTIGVANVVQHRCEQENTPHRTAMIVTAINGVISLATFLATGQHHKVVHAGVAPIFILTIGYGLFYYLTRIGAECVLAFREGLQGGRTVAPNHTRD